MPTRSRLIPGQSNTLLPLLLLLLGLFGRFLLTPFDIGLVLCGFLLLLLVARGVVRPLLRLLRGLLVRLGELGGHGEGFAALLDDRAAIEEALRFGAAVGALAVTRQGSFAAMPAPEEVRRLLGGIAA